MRWLIIVLGGSLVIVGALARPPAKEVRTEHERPLLPRKELLQIVGAAYRSVVADYFWIQTLHATGKAGNRYEYRDIYDYADVVTDVDPRFQFAYVFASTAVTFNLGRDTWVNTEESTSLLQKGLRQFPNHLYMRILLSFNYSYYHREPLRAARLLEETSRLPGAPRYLSALATRLYAQSGDFDAGLMLAHQLSASADDSETRAAFERRVKEIELERELKRVDASIALFEAREGRLPHTIQELVDRGDLDEIPLDPLGGQIFLGLDGRSRSTSSEDRLEAHGGVSNREHPQQEHP